MRGRRLLRIAGGSTFGGRVLVASLTSTVVALVLFAGSAFFYEAQSSETNLREQLGSLARILASTNKQGMSLAELGMGGAAFEEDKAAFREVLIESVRVTRAGLVHRSGDLYMVYPEGTAADRFPPPNAPEEVLEGQDELWIHHPISLDGVELGYVVLQGSRAILAERRVRYVYLLLGATVLATLLSVLITNRLRLTLTRPITDMIRTTNLVTHSKEYTHRVPETGDGELLALAEHINHMLSSINERDQRLSRSEQAVRELNENLNDKNTELETIIYVTSHDLRSPLVNIQGFGRELDVTCEELRALLEEGEGADSPEVRRILLTDIPEALSFILASSAKMGALLSGLLRLSRLGTAALAPRDIDANRMLTEIRKTFEFRLQEHQIEWRCADLDPCYGDPVQINQAFSNLLDNAIKYTAIKYTHPGPAEGEHGVVEISSTAEEQRVVYRISDNGVGISPDFHGKIFEVFHRLEPGRTPGEGLGLTITQRMVKRNGGEISVESREGGGTTFLMSLPSEARFSPDPELSGRQLRDPLG